MATHLLKYFRWMVILFYQSFSFRDLFLDSIVWELKISAPGHDGLLCNWPLLNAKNTRKGKRNKNTFLQVPESYQGS